MKIRISEVFSSFQGEGVFTGKPTVFVRFFGCNLECNGFGQKNPADPSTYILPYQTFDASKITSVNDLPVFEYGCDSSYSWSSRYKHLVKDFEVGELVDEIVRIKKDELGLVHGWQSNVGNIGQLCFTGGEPMLYQKAMNAICLELQTRRLRLPMVTIETNATKDHKELCLMEYTDHLHFACSPKLFYVSGEKDAVKPKVIESYINNSDSGALKFVHNGSTHAWCEVSDAMEKIRPLMMGKHWSSWIMPVGATQEQQESKHIGGIAEEALRRGYNISGRLHCYVFGNQVGT